MVKVLFLRIPPKSAKGPRPEGTHGQERAMPADAILFATESNQEVWEMNSRFQKVLRGSLFTALMALFLMLPGCPLVEAGGLVYCFTPTAAANACRARRWS